MGRHKRDSLTDRDSASYHHTIHPVQRTVYPAADRYSGPQPITRRNVAIISAACVAACLAAPALSHASQASSNTPSPRLKPWKGAGKPSFSLDSLHGDRRDLQAFAGKAVLVHFFATWCEPCVSEINSLQRLATATRDKPLAIVAVDVAEVDLRVRAFFEKRPVDFTVLLDRDRAISKSWDVTVLPTTFVLDPTLTPRFLIESDLDWSRPDILATIESLYLATGRP